MSLGPAAVERARPVPWRWWIRTGVDARAQTMPPVATGARLTLMSVMPRDDRRCLADFSPRLALI